MKPIEKSFFTIILFISLSIPSKAQIAEIPFELKDNIILLKVKVNEKSEEKVFVFDTGATSDLIDSTSAYDLGLEANYQQNVSGAGGKKTYDIILFQKLKLQNNIEIDSTHLVISDLSALKNALERNFDGIIGYSLLKKYVTKIDYDNQVIQLYNGIEEINTLAQYETMPFEFNNGIPIPQFELSFSLRNGEKFTGNILFDSGASLTLYLNTPFNEKNQISKKAGKSLVSKSENLHGHSTSEIVAINSLQIGDFQLGEMVIPISHDKSGVSSYENYLGILGAEVISRFNVILDYASFKLYLKPNQTFKNAFEFPLSGIKLKKKETKIFIDRIDKTCDAYKKGLRKGDQIVSIEGDTSLDLERYRDYLKKEGKKIKISILDANESSKQIEINLIRLL